VDLTFPPDALDENITITVRVSSSFPADERLIEGTVFELGTSGIQFRKPVQLTLRYDASKIPAGAREESLRLAKVAHGQWEIVAGSAVNATSKTVTGQVTGFSIYGVLAASASDETRIEPNPAVAAAGQEVRLDFFIPMYYMREMAAQRANWYWTQTRIAWVIDGTKGRVQYHYRRNHQWTWYPNGSYELEVTYPGAQSPTEAYYTPEESSADGEVHTVRARVYMIFAQESAEEGGSVSEIVFVGEATGTVIISGVAIRLEPYMVCQVRPGEDEILTCRILGRPPVGAEMTYRWSTSGRSGHLEGVGPPDYVDEQGRLVYESDRYCARYRANEGATDGAGDKVSVAAYMVEGAKKTLIGESEVDVDIYAPTEWYSLCSDPLCTRCGALDPVDCPIEILIVSGGRRYCEFGPWPRQPGDDDERGGVAMLISGTLEFPAREDDEILLRVQPCEDVHGNLIRGSFKDLYIRKGRCGSPTLARLLFAGRDNLQEAVELRSRVWPP